MDLEELKKKRLEELQNQLQNQQLEALKEQAELQKQVEVIETIAKQYLTKEAIQRYGNLKSAHPEKAIQAIALIAQAVQAGQIKEKIDDKQFKSLLIELKGPKQDFKIKKV